MGEGKDCPCAAVIQAQKDLKDHNDRLHVGSTKFGVMETQLDTIVRDIQEIKADLKELKEKPGKKWEGVTGRITDWAVILILGYMALQVGIN